MKMLTGITFKEENENKVNKRRSEMKLKIGEKLTVGFMGLMLLIGAAMLITPGLAAGQDEISYSGSSTIGTGILDAGALKAFEAKTGIKFKSVEQPGSGKGIKALIEGR